METLNPLPIELLFNLLCVCRRALTGQPRALYQALHLRGLYFGRFEDLPRLSFWVRLCQEASLLDEGSPPQPTLLVADWLAMPYMEQIAHLFEAWQQVPASAKIRQVRRHLTARLSDDAPLGPIERRELRGLQALGICAEEWLTPVGRLLLRGQFHLISQPQPRAWQIRDQELHIPYPPNWAWLWDLESYLEPIDPGVYPLDAPTLRLAVQRGALWGDPDLFSILERGLGEPLPLELIQTLQSQPLIRVHHGLVLEFTQPKELLQLRESPSMRSLLDHLLSPHHVLLESARAVEVMRRLFRRGLLSKNDMETLADAMAHLSSPQANWLTKADRACLLALWLLASGLGAPLSLSPALFTKLSAGMDAPLRAAAARKAAAVLKFVQPAEVWLPEEEPPDIPEGAVIAALERAIQRQETIDILYRAAGRSMAEHRHLTPLLIEQRGLRFYLIAYCHTRRANRTFRIDRLQLLDQPPG
jgi:hypothetical protein